MFAMWHSGGIGEECRSHRGVTLKQQHLHLPQFGRDIATRSGKFRRRLANLDDAVAGLQGRLHLGEHGIERRQQC
jgi:hypothetical protein